ncbi:MAG: hypothetical protein OEZ22_06170 [Spirochaetia bacterium]|nr:hypothetical protein [Spirochaetia bacterium]
MRKRWLFLISAIFLNCLYLEDTNIPTTKYAPSFSTAKKEYKNNKSAVLFKNEENNKSIFLKNIYIFNRPLNDSDDFISYFLKLFHWTTEKSVIEDELIIQKEKNNDENSILESERLLRQLRSIKDAYIYFYENEDKSYDALVYTEDRLSTSFLWGIEGAGGYGLFYLGAKSENLLGRLYGAQFYYIRENFINNFDLYLDQPRIAGTKFAMSANLSFNYVNNKNNYRGALIHISLPFIQLNDKYSFLAYYSNSRGVKYRFEGYNIEKSLDEITGNEVSLVSNKENKNWKFDAGRALGKFNRAEVFLSYNSYFQNEYLIDIKDQYKLKAERRDDVSNFFIQNQLSRKIDAKILSAKVNLKSINFITRQNFQSFLVTEDFIKGTGISFMFSKADRLWFSKDEFYIIGSFFYYIYDKNNIRNEFYAYRGARKNQNINQLWIDDLFGINNKLFYFLNYGILGLRIFYAQGNNLEKDSYFTTAQGGGSISSLYDSRWENYISLQNSFIRGYPHKEYEGENAYLISFEYRTPPIILPYLAAGLVFFMDIGQISKINFYDINHFSPLKSLGIGLRGSLYEFDKTLFRLDIGFPIDNKIFDFSTQISFDMSQSF